MKLSRRHFLALGVVAAGAAGAGYARFLEPGWLEVREIEVRLPNPLPSSPVRLLHLADFHRSEMVPLSFIEKAIEAGLAMRPDLICITGDFVTFGESQDLAEYRSVLEQLPQAAPTYAVLGNHDGGEWSRRYQGLETIEEISLLLEQAGISLLSNSSRLESIGGNTIRLVGTADLWAGGFDLDAAFHLEPEEAYSATLLLAHNPDTKDRAIDFAWDLMLSGHTHGGQIVIPGLGAPWAPVLDHRYLAGLHSWNRRLLHVSRGVGNLFGLRMNCRPEVTLLNLR